MFFFLSILTTEEYPLYKSRDNNLFRSRCEEAGVLGADTVAVVATTSSAWLVVESL